MEIDQIRSQPCPDIDSQAFEIAKGIVSNGRGMDLPRTVILRLYDDFIGMDRDIIVVVRPEDLKVKNPNLK